MNRTLKPLLVLLAALMGDNAHAEGERAGEFDYYVMALSWSPAWCETQTGRTPDQCAPEKDHGFTLHGLWPQNEQGWPSFCRTRERDPSRSQTRDMVDIMGSAGLAWHQWKKHGRCSGLSASDYFEASRKAYNSITRPEIFRELSTDIEIAPRVIEAAILEQNQHLDPDGVTIVCKSGSFREARICLTKSLEPRKCSNQIRRYCSKEMVDFPAIK